MTWFFEEPVAISLIGGGLIFVLMVAWVQTGKNQFLAWAVGVVLLTALCVVWERNVTTDKEAVIAEVYNIAREVERNDVQALATHFLQSKPEYAQKMRAELPRHQFTEARVTQIHRVEIDPQHQPPQVVIEFNVSVSGSFEAGQFPNQTFLRWVRVTFWKEEDGVWRVADYEHTEPTHFMKKRDAR